MLTISNMCNCHFNNRKVYILILTNNIVESTKILCSSKKYGSVQTMDMQEIIKKCVEQDEIYKSLKYSSLERIIINTMNKTNNLIQIADQIIERTIKAMNRQYKTSRDSNRNIRSLKQWLYEELKWNNEIILVTKIIMY